MVNSSKLDKTVWQEYMEHWDDVYIESEKLRASKKHTTIEKLYDVNLDDYKEVEGKEVQRLVKVRVNQSIFREVVLSNFDNKCCITGINMVDLIVANNRYWWFED